MEKILVIQTAFPGDAVLTLPMLRELKTSFPESKLDVVAIPATASIFEHSPAVDEVIILDKRGTHKSLSGLCKFSKEIRKREYTKIYSPHRSFRSSFLVWQSGVRETYGFSNASLRHVYKHLIEYHSSDHEVKRNLTLAGADTSDDKWKIVPELLIPPEVKKTVDDFLASEKISSFIAVAPGSVWETKKYPAENFSTVINYFSAKGKTILLIGGIDDAGLCEEIKSSTRGNVISIAGKFSIIETVELLKYAEILICNDSAPTHFGQSADIPVLTLYCSTIAEIGFYPYNSKSTYLSYDALACKPCGIHGRNECPIKTFACGYNLKPDAVILKIAEMLNDKV